jgi:hypothetical protein
MGQNVSLIRELNELRREIKVGAGERWLWKRVKGVRR